MFWLPLKRAGIFFCLEQVIATVNEEEEMEYDGLESDDSFEGKPGDRCKLLCCVTVTRNVRYVTRD